MITSLHIDTALSTSSVAISNEQGIIVSEVQCQQNEVGKWLHESIDLLLKKADLNLSDISFVSVTEGPGSYTGLRIGMSTAKGLCFAINKPLITISNLQLFVHQITNEIKADFYIPVIDARRNEVFTAVYDNQKKTIKPLHSLILTEDTFSEYFTGGSVCFCGNAVEKTKHFIHQQNAIFSKIDYTLEAIQQISFEKFLQKEFADIVYCEPQYGKPFYFTS